MATLIDIDPHGDLLLQFPAPRQLGSAPVDAGSSSPAPWESASHVHRTDQTPDAVSDPQQQRSGLAQGARLHQQPVHLRVSSSVLSLVSPVFHSLLSGPMAEAQAFQAPDSPRPFPLPLPEDDGSAFTVLAHVIHHRTEHIPRSPSTELLLQLAILADKYACGPALIPYGTLWMQRAMQIGIEGPPQSEYIQYSALGAYSQPRQQQQNPGQTQQEEMYWQPESDALGLEARVRMLLFSYVIDLPFEFFAISWEILIRHRQLLKDEIERDGFDLPMPEGGELMRHDLLGAFSRRKTRLRRDVHAALMAPITSLSPLFGSAPGSPRTCPHAKLAAGAYMVLLDGANLCAWRTQFETDSFLNIVQRALVFAEAATESRDLAVEMCNGPRCGCGGFRYGEELHLAKRLFHAMARAREWRLGICLDCLKGCGDKDGGTCRVEHW